VHGTRVDTIGDTEESDLSPFYFHPANHGLAAFAGVSARAHDGRGDALLSVTIITARAAELVRPIHDRMPIVLAPDAWAAWLDPSVDAAHARKLLEAADLPAGPAIRSRPGSTEPITMVRSAWPRRRPSYSIHSVRPAQRCSLRVVASTRGVIHPWEPCTFA
jgi:hypothetical protein